MSFLCPQCQNKKNGHIWYCKFLASSAFLDIAADANFPDYAWYKTSSPRVQFSGYSIPHPSDNKVNIRVQTTGICEPVWLCCELFTIVAQLPLHSVHAMFFNYNVYKK